MMILKNIINYIQIINDHFDKRNDSSLVPSKYLVVDIFPRPIIFSYLVIATKSKSREPSSLKFPRIIEHNSSRGNFTVS